MYNITNAQNTVQYQPVKEESMKASEVLSRVYEALSEKGYNPVDQIVGYIMSGDPTYITNHNQARSIIRRCERDELLEEILNVYVENKFSEGAGNKDRKIA